ncbi:MAG: lysostaphin resistance A-like protein [Candidatus Heimdallarchaeota archaeon]
MSEDELIQQADSTEEILDSNLEGAELQQVSFSEGKFCARATLWTTVIYSSVFELIGLIVISIALLIGAITHLVEPGADGSYDETSPRFLFTIILVNIVAVIFMGVVVYIINKRTSYIPSTQKFSLNKFDIKMLFGALALIIFLVGGIEFLNSYILARYFPDFTVASPYNFLSSDNPYVILIASILVIVVAPIVEEMFYRWTIVSTLKKGMNTSATVLFSAFIFALAHSATNLAYSFYFFIIHFITTFIIGAILGFVYLKTKKVIVTILLHAVWNAITVVGATLEYAGIGYGFNIAFLVLIGISGLAIITLLVLYLIKQRKENQIKKSTENNEEETSKPKIKLQGEWFGLILGYFGFNVLLPFLILKIFTAINFYGEIILLIYLCVIIVVSFYLLTNQYKLYDKYTKGNQKMALESSEEIE